ncbi:MAG TPA: GntR family transcriptional regulator [Sphingobium sp.]
MTRRADDTAAGEPAVTDRLGDEAYRRLEKLFVTGALKPGSLISESQLTERIGMGRAPVWAAIKRFEAGQLLRPVHRKGIFVLEVSPKDQLYLGEVRRPLEIFIFRTAAERATADERKRLLEEKANFLRAHAEADQAGVMQADFEYKNVAITATRNPFIAQAIGSIHVLARRFWNIDLEYKNRSEDMASTIYHHVAIIEATAAGDADGAEAAVNAFIDFLRQVTLRILNESIQL